METKNPNEFVLQKLDQLNYEEHILVPLSGHGAGGLALLWKKELKLEVISSDSHCIDTKIIFEGKSFYSTFVYGNTDRNQRRAQWDQLVSVATQRDAEWFITRDFSDILCADEKDGGPQRPEGSFSDLRSFYSEGDLFDLRHSGDQLSWRGQRGEHFVRCRLDRAAANSAWAETFPTARAHYLAFEGSDHKPLLSFFEPERKRRKGLFRYDRRLKYNLEVKDLVAKTWSHETDEPILLRISRVRRVIYEWSKEHGRNSRVLIEQKKLALNEALSSPRNDTSLIAEITKELKKAYSDEEAYWKQRSRLLWLSLGDRNTGYFHAVMKGRKQRNALTVLEDEEGNVMYKEEDIAKGVVKYFQELFTSKEGNRADTVRHALRPMISSEVNLKLIEPPSALEVREATFSINAKKAPGPDRFSASFYHSNWEAIGPTIVKKIQGIFESGILSQNINSTRSSRDFRVRDTVCLITKIVNPQKISDYRPIALCNVYYKIISKIIT